MKKSILAAIAATGFALSCAGPQDDEAAAQADSLARSDTDGLAPFTAPLAIGSMSDHSCVFARRGVVCWGRNTSGQLNVPALRRPRQLSVGTNYTCAVDDDGIKCWGNNTSGQGTVPATLVHPRQVSAAGTHTCAIDDVGVKCWGNNTSGQTSVPPLREPTQVRAGGTHTCAVDADGVKCWGANNSGQTTVPPLRNPTQVGVGTLHTCALDADGVKCWGSNESGRSTVPPLRDPTQIAVGMSHSCAIDADGVKCWGSNASTQTTVPAMHRPTQILLGKSHSCALDDDDQIKCWGGNLLNQTKLPPELALTGRHACVVASEGLKCTGDNERGQLGMGSDKDQIVAFAATGVTDLGRSFASPSQFALGHAFGCALSSGGAVKCWGGNRHGQLGLGDTRDRGVASGEMGDALPELQFGASDPITKIAVGDDHACALSARGDVSCWGKGSTGQLGTEATDDVGTTSGPVHPHFKAGLAVRDLALGRGHTCVLSTDGDVYCFGSNSSGQLGIGRTGATGDRPDTMGEAMQPVLLGDGFRAKALASGDYHTCALSQGGAIKCWGAADAGQLGLGDTRARGVSADDMGAALPVVDLGHGQVAVELSCGSNHCCARMIQNTLKCWGGNADGQLGLGDVVTRGADPSSMGDDLPFLLTPPGERVRSIQLDADRTCARTDSGLRCWGRNAAGELGYGDRQARGATRTTVPRLLNPLGT